MATYDALQDDTSPADFACGWLSFRRRLIVAISCIVGVTRRVLRGGAGDGDYVKPISAGGGAATLISLLWRGALSDDLRARTSANTKEQFVNG